MSEKSIGAFGTLLNFPATPAQSTLSYIDMIVSRLVLERGHFGHSCSSSLLKLYENELTDYNQAAQKHAEIQSTLKGDGFQVLAFEERVSIAFKKNKDEPFLDVWIAVSSYGDSLTFNIFGQLECVAQVVEKYKREKRPGARIRTIVEFDPRGGSLTTSDFVAATPESLGRDSFYPFMKTSLVKYFDQFLNSSASVMVLVGPAGTGKSTFLRTLILQHTTSALMAYSKEVLESPKLMNFYHESSATLLGLEDVDVFVQSRENGNTVMASFLNSSEGVVRSAMKKKIVFSTNLPSVNKIDPALLRRGRCFDVVEFRHLTVIEARSVERDMGLPKQDLSFKENWSLAEILNPPHSFLQLSDRTRQHIGFAG